MARRRRTEVAFRRQTQLPNTSDAQCRQKGYSKNAGTYLKQPPAPGVGDPVQRQARANFFIHIDAQDAQDFFSEDGRGAGTRARGSFPKGVGRLSEKSPAGYSPHRTIGRTAPASAGVPPACTPVRCRSVSLRCGTRPLCRRERHGLGRGRVLALLPVEPGGGVGRGCAKTCAGGTPALPVGFIP